MSYTATVNGYYFADLAQDEGEYLKDFISSPIWDRRSFHPPGSKGEMVCKMGSIAEKIIMTGKIIASSPSAWYLTYRNLIDSWGDDQAPFEIIGPNGDTYSRCYMQPESLYVSSPLMSMGDRDGSVFGEFRVAFVDYAGNP